MSLPAIWLLTDGSKAVCRMTHKVTTDKSGYYVHCNLNLSVFTFRKHLWLNAGHSIHNTHPLFFTTNAFPICCQPLYSTNTSTGDSIHLSSHTVEVKWESDFRFESLVSNSAYEKVWVTIMSRFGIIFVHDCSFPLMWKLTEKPYGTERTLEHQPKCSSLLDVTLNLLHLPLSRSLPLYSSHWPHLCRITTPPSQL